MELVQIQGLAAFEEELTAWLWASTELVLDDLPSPIENYEEMSKIHCAAIDLLDMIDKVLLDNEVIVTKKYRDSLEAIMEIEEKKVDKEKK